MSKKLTVAIIGGIIALVVGFAASNGLITQETADEIKTQSEQILSEDGTSAPAPEAAPETTQVPAEPTTTAAPTEPSAPADEAAPADDAAISVEPTEPATQEPAASAEPVEQTQ